MTKKTLHPVSLRKEKHYRYIVETLCCGKVFWVYELLPAITPTPQLHEYAAELDCCDTTG